MSSNSASNALFVEAPIKKTCFTKTLIKQVKHQPENAWHFDKMGGRENGYNKTAILKKSMSSKKVLVLYRNLSMIWLLLKLCRIKNGLKMLIYYIDKRSFSTIFALPDLRSFRS